MLHEAKSLKCYKLDGPDGELGKAKDFYCDDQHWTNRHLLADTGNFIVRDYETGIHYHLKYH